MEKSEFFAFIGTMNRYILLDRMRSDCDYYLGNGGRSEKYLWGHNVPQHIRYMKWLWESFPEGEKPEWLTLGQIEEYEKRMEGEKR